jgi:DNA-binding protein H-NS
VETLWRRDTKCCEITRAKSINCDDNKVADQKKGKTDVATPDLNKMSLDDLRALRANVEAALKSYQRRKRTEAIAAARAKAQEHGYRLEDLIDEPFLKGNRNKSAPRYQHPENPEVTWTGRGRRPDWIREGIESGKSLEDFEI